MENKLGSLLTKVNDYIQYRIDTTKFFIDPPQFDYQPLPWLGIEDANIRGEATYERWNAISPYLENCETLKDIGCCVGFFCHKATEGMKIRTVGIDINDRFLRIANYTKKFVKNGEIESFFNLTVNKDSVHMLPETDSTILFSVWHHWVYYYGIDTATFILQEVWNKTNKILFFESGEEETKEEFNLPFNRKASDWLFEYLREKLPLSQVKVLGEFSAGNYSHYELKNHKRTVFAVMKK